MGSPQFKRKAADEVPRIVEGTAEAIMCAHGNRTVYADLKPANPSVTDEGQTKVIDFGIARTFKRAGGGEMDVTRFAPGPLGASAPGYASPETAEREVC
jgi:serine/threonine protein kinase